MSTVEHGGRAAGGPPTPLKTTRDVKGVGLSIPRPDGPDKVTGPVTVIDADGTEYDLSEMGEAVALCRCGGSTTKPFCDGTHSKIGFDAAERAVRESG